MRQVELEPGFLQAFRLFVATRIVFWAVVGPVLIVVQMASDAGLTPNQGASLPIIEKLTPPNVYLMIALELVLLLMLLLPQVQRRLGNLFVPVALLFAMVPLLIGYYWWPSENPLQTPFVMFFFVMLVLIAWQYPFRYVVAYVVGLSLYQLWVSSPLSNAPATADVSWLVLQGAMMLLVGYIIVALVSIQREQRAALAQAYELQAAANARLKQYAATVEELSISRERNRLARELHDTLAHSLSALTVQLEAVRSLWDVDSGKAYLMLDKADETARTGLTEARRALQALRASPLQEVGLILALEDLAEAAAERSGAALELHMPGQIQPKVPAVVEQGVYRIAQEALENVVRHAGAGSILLTLEQREESLTLLVRDDGHGIRSGDARHGDGTRGEGLGLRGIRERASVIGGRLEIRDWEQGGTEVRLTVRI